MTKRFYPFKLPLLTLILSKVILQEKAKRERSRMLGALSKEYLRSYSFFLQDLRNLLAKSPLEGFIYKIMLDIALDDIDQRLKDVYAVLDLNVEAVGVIRKAPIEDEIQTSFEFELETKD